MFLLPFFSITPMTILKMTGRGSSSAFSKIREEHSELLKEIVFRKNLLFPRSRVLDEIFSCLQPEFLGKINPTYELYKIKKDELKRLWDKELKSSLGDKEAEIKKMADELKTLL